MSHCRRSQKTNVLFILVAFRLFCVPSHFLRLDLPQRLCECFLLRHVTICCRWDVRVTLLLTVDRTGAFAAQDAGVQQTPPVRWWADVSVGLIISWETDPQASSILQAVVNYRVQTEKKKWNLGFHNGNQCVFEQLLLSRILLYFYTVVQKRLALKEKKKSPRRFGWRLVLWFDEIPQIGKCSCKIKSDK